MGTSSRSSLLTILAAVSLLLLACAPSRVFESRSPAFSIQYPAGWVEADARSETEYFLANTGSSKPPNINVTSSEMAATATQQANGTCDYFRNHYKSPSCRVLDATDTRLADGTPAFDVQLEWMWPGGTMLYTCCLVAKKGGVTLSACSTDLKPVRAALKKYLRTFQIR